MNNDTSTPCAHCDATGTCLSKDKSSCDYCLMTAKDELSIKNSSLKVVGCGYCNGTGIRNIDKEYFHKQTLSSLNHPIDQTLTGYHVKKEEETKRVIDYRKFIISISALIVGIIIISFGLYFKKIELLLPVASSVLTGAFYYFGGGEILNRNNKKEKKSNE